LVHFFVEIKNVTSFSLADLKVTTNASGNLVKTFSASNITLISPRQKVELKFTYKVDRLDTPSCVGITIEIPAGPDCPEHIQHHKLKSELLYVNPLHLFVLLPNDNFHIHDIFPYQFTSTATSYPDAVIRMVGWATGKQDPPLLIIIYKSGFVTYSCNQE